MNKKKNAPTSTTKSTGNPPGPELRFIQVLEQVEDPRALSCNFLHPLTSILFVTVVCSLCGADDWEACSATIRIAGKKSPDSKLLFCKKE